MTANNEPLSREPARALDQIALNAKSTKTADILSACDEIESSFVARLSKFPDLAMETRRRVAESKFDLLSERETPWEMVETLHARIRTLGYADMEREATREIIFARACLHHKRPKLAEPALQNVSDKLSEQLRIETSDFYERVLY